MRTTLSSHTNQKPDHHETSLQAQLRQEVEEGMATSRDPDNAGLPDLVARTTTMYSPWYTLTCPECKHHFREGDRARLCPACGQAYHDDSQYSLHCWQKHFANRKVCKKPRRDPIAEVDLPGCLYCWFGNFPDAPKEANENTRSFRRVAGMTDQFLRGVEKEWKPFGEETVVEVQENHSIIGHKCPWCRFQIRAGDRVVKCPCGKCNTYFHHDVFRHLTCWNGWNGTRGNDYCPTTGAGIERNLLSTEGEEDD